MSYIAIQSAGDFLFSENLCRVYLIKTGDKQCQADQNENPSGRAVMPDQQIAGIRVMRQNEHGKPGCCFILQKIVEGQAVRRVIKERERADHVQYFENYKRVDKPCEVSCDICFIHD